MGVTQLWQILSPIQEHQSLTSLGGLVLAVDLSIWICESDGVKHMQGVVAKPYLRNLFFRILHLTQIGVKLVFVIEGSAPELKWEIMAKRQQSRFPGRQGKPTASQKPTTKHTRKNFNAILKECCELLDILGIPYIQSKGEAEAMCALLNSSGLVDGCLTDDGDAFLYGAKTVYRNFTMNAKDPHVERYCLSDIESTLGIDRSGLVALALLLGCDFLPKGVSGIGMANAVKLLDCLKGRNVLERLQDWRRIHESQCVDPIEKMVRLKALNAPDFPQMDVINEFLHPKDRCPSRLSPWKRPVTVKLQEFALIKLEWPVEYTLEKVLPLVTLWDMQDVLQSKNPSKHQHLRPHRIVKTRVRQGVPCYEIEWFKPVTDPYHDSEYYVTIESQEMFSSCYPAIVQAFFSETTNKNKKKKAKKKKTKEKTLDRKLDSDKQAAIENLSFNFGKLNIKSVTRKLQESLQDLQPTFTDYEGSVLTTKVKQSTLSPTPSKVNTLHNTNDFIINSGNFKEPGQILTCNAIEAEDSDLPFSDRIKLKLKQKKQKSVTSEEQVFNSAVRGSEMLSQTGSKSTSKRKKKKTKTRSRNENNLENAVAFSFKRDISLNSPLSPFMNNSGLQGNMGDMKSKKMSSPASNMFCSPASYIKQSVKQGDTVFMDSPIQTHVDNGSSRTPKTTLTNFSFFDTPERQSSLSNYKATSHISQSQSGGVQTTKPTTPSFLKGEWQTEFIEDYLQELSKDLTLNANRTVQSMTDGKTSLNQVLQTQPSSKKSGMEPMLEQNLTQFNETQEVNFKLQSSLLNSLCASLIQTLTPKGMNKEQYDSLCESLKKIDHEGKKLDQDFKTKGSENVTCNIDFTSEVEEASKLQKTLRSDNNFKSLNYNKGVLGAVDCLHTNTTDGLSKSARKKLRKKLRKSENVTATQGQDIITCDKEGTRVGVNFSNLNGHMMHKAVAMTRTSSNRKCLAESENNRNVCQSTSNMTMGSQKQSNMVPPRLFHCEERVAEENIDQDSVNQAIKKKKKSRKKKIRKASPVIDLSADTSMLDEPQYKICSEYLKTALTAKPKSNPHAQKIQKASPIIDLSADDQFFELDILSSSLSGDKSSLDADIKRKLTLKKILSKKQSGKEDILQVSTCQEQTDVCQDPLPSLKGPVFSMNTAFSDKANKMEESVDIEGDHETETHGSSQTEEILDEKDRVTDLHEEGVCDASQCEITATREGIHKHDDKEMGKVRNDEEITCKETCSRYDEEILKAMEDLLLSTRSSSRRSDTDDGVNINRCTRKVASEFQHVVNKRCLSKRTKEMPDAIDQSIDEVFSHQRTLDFGSYSNDAKMLDTYERNIQSCKDLRSWSMLPSSSNSYSCKLKRLEKSSRLKPAFNLHGMHKHENKRHASTTSCTIHSQIVGKPVQQTYTDTKRKNESMSDMTDIDVNDCSSDVDCVNLDNSKKMNFDDHVDKEFDDENNDPRKVLDCQLVKKKGESTEAEREDSMKVLDSVKSEEQTRVMEEAVVDTMKNGLTFSDQNHGSEIKVTNSDQRFNKTFEVEGLKEEPDDDPSDFTPEDMVQASCSLIGTRKDNPSLKSSILLFHEENSGPDDQNDCCKVMDSENITKPNQSNFRKDNSDLYLEHPDERVDNAEKVNDKQGTTVIEENCKERTCDNAIEIINMVEDCNVKSYEDDTVNVDNLHVQVTKRSGDFQGSIQNGHDTEGSSDKENEKGVENDDTVATTASLNDSSIDSANLHKEGCTKNFPSSSAMVEETNLVEQTSSPVPLLDRLKMKFKKSSARSVLHSFTNGR